MKQNTFLDMKKMMRNTANRITVIGCCLLVMIMSACSDIEFPGSASDSKGTVSGLSYDNPQGTRQLTLSWTLPAGDVTGIQIIKDDADIIELEGPQTSYFIKKAPTNVDVSYTVKARFADGTVSKGQTVRLFIAYEAQKGGSKIAMLLPNDYASGSADENAAAEWFKRNYVNTGKGILLTPANIDDLDIESQSACWVMCDRIGIGHGWDKLPGGLATTATIEALKAFAADGGNLLLTNHATQLTVGLGRIAEAYAPGIFGDGEGGQNNDIWGVHPIIGNVEGQIYDHSRHDIYRGMTYEPGLYAGIYCFEGAGVKGDHNCMWDLNAYGLAPNPNVVKTWEETTNSTVLGTWNHVVDYCCAGIVDFEPTTNFTGRILAVGLAAYEWDLGTANEKQDQLEKFTANCLKYVGTPAEKKVAMLVPDDYTTSADENDAVKWFKKTYVDTGKGEIFTPSTIDDLDIEKNPMCWVMCDRIGIGHGWDKLPGGLATTATIEALKAFAADGGNLLLTNHATQLTVGLGRIAEAYAPGIFGDGEGGQNNDIWGVHPIIGNIEGQIYDHSRHDIYWGMTYEPGLYAGIYCFEGAGVKGDHNCMWDLNAYGLAPNPNVVKTWEETTNSTVLGTWNHVVDYCCAGIVDFEPTTTFAGRILAVGLAAYEWNLGTANEKQDQLERFTSNCISYLK